MKKIFIALLFFPGFLLAQNKGFEINGKVTGLPDGAIVKILSTQQEGVVLASGPAKAEGFTITGTLPEPGLFWLVLGSAEAQHIYLENSKIKVAGSVKDIKHLKIEGSTSHKEFDEFRKVFNPLVGDLNGTAAEAGKESNAKKRDAIMQKYDSLTKRINTEVGKFVTTHQASFVSPFVLFVTAQLIDDPFLMEQHYNKLDNTVKNSSVGKSLQSYIAYNKVGAIGTDAIDFSQSDVNGVPVSLSSFKGKYVLIDFWASWCRPCRAENPNVVKAFDKFKAKNFTVLGVSLDQQRDAWIKAIEKDGLKWTHVSDLQQWNNAVAVQYHVQSIPQNFLVDPNGKIVAKNLRGEDLEAKLCELLGCN